MKISFRRVTIGQNDAITGSSKQFYDAELIDILLADLYLKKRRTADHKWLTDKLYDETVASA